MSADKSLIKAKIGLLLVIVSLLFLPLATFKPNRVSRGIPLRSFDIFGPAEWAGTAFLILLLAAYAFRKSTVSGYISMIIPSAMILLISGAQLSGIGYIESAARISLGIGFWIILTGTVLVESTLKHSSVVFAATLILIIIPPAAGWTLQLALYKEFMNLRLVFWTELRRHMVLALSSAALAVIPGIALGFWCHSKKKSRTWIFGFVNFFQVAPTLSLLALMMIPLTALSLRFTLLSDLGISGIGFAPAFIVLFLYCLLPITANACAGFDQVDEDVLLSATAMGMKQHIIFRKVKIPLAMPVIMSGIRTAFTQNLGNTILAGLIGGGGMGSLIFLGLSQSAPDMVILATIPVVLLALLADNSFRLFEKKLKLKIGVPNDPAE